MMELLQLVAALPMSLAAELPNQLTISGFKGRDSIFAGINAELPHVLHLGLVRAAAFVNMPVGMLKFTQQRKKALRLCLPSMCN